MSFIANPINFFNLFQLIFYIILFLFNNFIHTEIAIKYTAFDVV